MCANDRKDRSGYSHFEFELRSTFYKDSLSAHYLGKFKVGEITFNFLFGSC